MEFMKSVDTWFLIMSVVLLGGFFLWATKYIFDGLQKSVIDLKDSFKTYGEKMDRVLDELFNHKNDHESRIVALETRCDIQHGESEHTPKRQSGGRRKYDPKEPLI
jgi:hypothetical protein